MRAADSLRRAPAGVATAGLLIALAVGFAGPVLVGEPPFTHVPGRVASPCCSIGRLELIDRRRRSTSCVFLVVVGSLVMLIRNLSGLVDDDPAFENDSDAEVDA